jgi:hypothetical protein
MVRFMNGDKRAYEVGNVESHQDAQNAIKEQLLGVATCVSMKLREPMTFEQPEAA